MRRKIPTVITVIEGPDFSGKTTVVERLHTHFVQEFLKSRHAGTPSDRVGRYREPGGTRIGEHLRSLLLDPQHKGITPAASLLIFAAQRAEFCRLLVEQAKAGQKLMILDRFVPSTYAYQVMGEFRGKMRFEDFRAVMELALAPLNKAIDDGLIELNMYGLDVPTKELLSRQKLRGGSDRFEEKDRGFQTRVRDAYAEMVKCAVADQRNTSADRSFAIDYLHLYRVDGKRTPEAVTGDLIDLITARLQLVGVL